jgi:hypothetical protein
MKEKTFITLGSIFFILYLFYFPGFVDYYLHQYLQPILMDDDYRNHMFIAEIVTNDKNHFLTYFIEKSIIFVFLFLIWIWKYKK